MYVPSITVQMVSYADVTCCCGLTFRLAFKTVCFVQHIKTESCDLKDIFVFSTFMERIQREQDHYCS